MFIVAVAIDNAQLTERMNTMRTWLDHRHCQPLTFRVVADEPHECRVQFRLESEAEAFALAFGGELRASPVN